MLRLYHHTYTFQNISYIGFEGLETHMLKHGDFIWKWQIININWQSGCNGRSLWRYKCICLGTNKEYEKCWLLTQSVCHRCKYNRFSSKLWENRRCTYLDLCCFLRIWVVTYLWVMFDKKQTNEVEIRKKISQGKKASRELHSTFGTLEQKCS